MNLYDNQFSEAHDFDKVNNPSKVLIIASTGRGGSHMLGHALHETKKFGFPLEYANPANLAEWNKRLGTSDVHSALAEIQQRRTSANGVFSIKVHYPHIKQFGGFHNLAKMFPNAFWVILTRKDVLKQAVSLSIARQTGVWISGQKPTNDHPQYDFSQINECLRETIINNSSWRYTLAANGSNYMEMNFDHVRNNLAQSIKDIAEFIEEEIDDSDIPAEQVTKKQSNTRNKEWLAKFTAEFDNQNELISKKEARSLFSKIKQKLNV